ncbi:RNA polymerase II elongation factor ELL2-like [Diceros bicornis minor]|uniref:RNA polymerase II elongation factor ELL2-like n=1 Tax=Diceros bicornis minor TaxID=77932 RepID=UPI0026F100EA|nr:RNA polymerase II elongation factor ELL2-like [Diceros bicornis minor]
MAATGGRAVGEVVHQEGEVAEEEANGIELRQDNVTVLPMQLTRPAIQAIDSYPNHENTVPPQTSLQFQGFRGLIKIPPNNSSTDVYNFNFQLSNVSKGNHQDHTQQTVSSYSPSQLNCLHLMQDKMIVYRTTNSYQITQVRTQAEEESCNRWKKIRKLYGEKRMPIQKAPQAIPDPVPERKRTSPLNPAYTIRKSRVPDSVHLRPFRDRVIHLLALKDYKKPELLFRLHKDGIQKNDEDSFENILHQVANLNTQDFSYTLKDYVFKELQRDWPGYSELEKQSLELVLSRSVDPFQNATGINHPESSIGSSTGKTSSPSQKCLSNSAVIDPLRKKKVRISHLTATVQSKSKGHLNNISEKSAVGLPSASANPILPPLPTTHLSVSNPPHPVHSNCNSSSTAEGPGTQDPEVDSFSQNSRIFESQQGKHTSLKTLASITIPMRYPKLMKKRHLMSDEKFKYKFIKHRAKNQVFSIEVMEKWKTDPERKGKGAKLNSSKEVKKVCTASGKTCSASGLPDYLTNYVTIVSSEQRWQYEQEFRAEYDEYRDLYAKMRNLSSIFNNLNSKRKHLTPGSKEYQDIDKRISLEYQKMKQANPNYCAEKYRYQYLYNKLFHIKRLIKDYDQQQLES